MTGQRDGAAAAASPLALLQQAVALHQQGKLGEAESVYRQVLALVPRNFDALHLLGVIHHQTGRYAQAVELIDEALAIKPDEAPAHSNRGLALAEVGRLEDAVASFDRALSLQGDFADALLNRGNVQARLGRHADALGSCDAVLALRPGDVRALHGRGDALLALGKPERALESYDRVLMLDPASANALANRGNALRELGRAEEAMTSYDGALAIRPDDPVTLTNRAVVLLDLDRPRDALASCDRALVLRPDSAHAHGSRGSALLALKRPEEALTEFDAALELQPGYPEAINSRGAVLLDLARPEEAMACFDRALALAPDYPEALNNRGLASRDLRRPVDALASFSRAIAAKPDYAIAHHNASLCHLMLGDFAAGWREFEYRWEEGPYKAFRRNFPRPLWLGAEPLVGKTILLHAEQGLGDTIQFCRYVRLVAAGGAAVLLEFPSVLEPLMQHLEGVSRLLAPGERLPDFDCHVPLLSLPLALGTRLESVPADVPYLFSDPRRVAQWRARLGAPGQFRIGVAWAGHPSHTNDRRRSLPLARMSDIFSFPAQFLSLQNALRPDDVEVLRRFPQLRHFGEDLRDFGDTAALIELVDLVVTVDTAVAHLAGAMGKPVWILLPFVPDWRWLLDRDDSPWYPTARLFRQPAAGDWGSVLRRVADALREPVSTGGR